MNKLAVNFEKANHNFGLDLKNDLKDVSSISSDMSKETHQELKNEDYIIQQLFSVNVKRFRETNLPPLKKGIRLPTIMLNNNTKLPKPKKKNPGHSIQTFSLNRFKDVKPKIITRNTSVPNFKPLFIKRSILPSIQGTPATKESRDLEKTNTNVYYLYYKANQPIKATKKRLTKLPSILPEPSETLTDDSASSQTTKEELALDFDTIYSKSETHPISTGRRLSFTLELQETQLTSSRRNSKLDEEIGDETKPQKSRRKSVAFAIDETGDIDNDGLEVSKKQSSRKERRRSSVCGESPFPMFDQMANKDPNHKVLTQGELKSLPLSQKFYSEAAKMVYSTEGKAFIPRGHLSNLEKMKKGREAEMKRQEEAWRRSRERASREEDALEAKSADDPEQ